MISPVRRSLLQISKPLDAAAGQPGWPPEWDPWRARLGGVVSRVEGSLALVAELITDSPPLPEPLCYQGRLYPARVGEILRARGRDTLDSAILPVP